MVGGLDRANMMAFTACACRTTAPAFAVGAPPVRVFARSRKRCGACKAVRNKCAGHRGQKLQLG